jgi:hypothetical protein
MGIYQLHANTVPVIGTIALPVALGWFCDTEAEAISVGAALGVGIIGTNGETFFPQIGDLVRVRGSDEINIIRSNGSIKKL